MTRLDHDGNVAPWLELARDRELVVGCVDIDPEDCTLDLASLEAALSERTRVVAFTMASNAVGTITDARRIVELAHGAGALAWVDAVHYAPHRPIDVEALGVDVLLCSPYKFFGPHLGLFYGRRELLERWRPYKVRPAPDEPVAQRFETGTLAARGARRLRGCRRVRALGRVGCDRRARARPRPALPRRAALLVPPVRASDDGIANADVRRRPPLAPARRGSGDGSRSRGSPFGPATTTRSRSWTRSGFRTGPCGSASSTTTRRRRSTGRSRRSSAL